MGCQPSLDGCDCNILILGLILREFQNVCDSDKVKQKGITTGSACPQDRAVFLLVAIGVLHGSLCLANTSKSTDGLGLSQYCRFAGCEIFMKDRQELFAPSEKGVAVIRDIPDFRCMRLLCW